MLCRVEYHVMGSKTNQISVGQWHDIHGRVAYEFGDFNIGGR